MITLKNHCLSRKLRGNINILCLKSHDEQGTLKMAKIHKGHNHLKEKARTNLILSILFILPTVIYFYAFIVHRFHFEGFYHLLGIVPAMIGF